MTAAQLTKIKEAHALLASLLAEVEGSEPTVEHPQWRLEEEKRWRLMKAVELAGGDLGSQEWIKVGAEHDYQSQGLGGFFRGATPYMGVQGARRVLTDHGKKFVARWEPEFGPHEA
jgi:hypothetical protein